MGHGCAINHCEAVNVHTDSHFGSFTTRATSGNVRGRVFKDVCVRFLDVKVEGVSKGNGSVTVTRPITNSFRLPNLQVATRPIVVGLVVVKGQHAGSFERQILLDEEGQCVRTTPVRRREKGVKLRKMEDVIPAPTKAPVGQIYRKGVHHGNIYRVASTLAYRHVCRAIRVLIRGFQVGATCRVRATFRHIVFCLSAVARANVRNVVHSRLHRNNGQDSCLLGEDEAM